MIYTLLLGLAAGALAKMITPQQEKGGWISSIIVGIIGSFVGRSLGGIIGLSGSGLIGSLLLATGGAVLVLFFYHRYLADKLDQGCGRLPFRAVMELRESGLLKLPRTPRVWTCCMTLSLFAEIRLV